VIAEEEEDKEAEETSKGNRDNGYDLINSQKMILFILMHMQGEVQAAHSNAIDHTEEDRPNEEHKVFVIPLANTRTQPRAMVIKALNTSSTKATMDGSRRPVDVTFITILNPCDPSIKHIKVLELLFFR